MGKTETGRTFTADSILFQVDKHGAFNDANPALQLIVDGLVPVYGEDQKHIGYALINGTDNYGRTRAQIFIDYASPERFDLEMGEKRYLHAIIGYTIVGHDILTGVAPGPEKIHIQRLEISNQPNKADAAIGEY